MPRKKAETDNTDATPDLDPTRYMEPVNPDADAPKVDPVTEKPDAPKAESPDSWKQDDGQGGDVDWPHYDNDVVLDRGRVLRDEVSVNQSGRRSLADKVDIGSLFGNGKGIDATKDVIGREKVKARITDGLGDELKVDAQVDRWIDPIRLSPDLNRSHDRNCKRH